jgi:hypothetical protein
MQPQARVRERHKDDGNEGEKEQRTPASQPGKPDSEEHQYNVQGHLPGKHEAPARISSMIVYPRTLGHRMAVFLVLAG